MPTASHCESLWGWDKGMQSFVSNSPSSWIACIDVKNLTRTGRSQLRSFLSSKDQSLGPISTPDAEIGLMSLGSRRVGFGEIITGSGLVQRCMSLCLSFFLENFSIQQFPNWPIYTITSRSITLYKETET